MKIRSILTHDGRDRGVPRTLLISEPQASHRPPVTFRVRIKGRSDVAIARRAGLPVHLLEPEVTAAWGFPNGSPGLLVVAREIAGLVVSDYAMVTLESTEAARSPRLEDLVVVLLRWDPLLARALALHHRKFLDPNQLLKRILQESVEEAATQVRLQSIVPNLPSVGDSLPEEPLLRHDQQAWVRGRL